MPELPEVEAVRRSLIGLTRQQVVAVTVIFPRLRWPIPTTISSMLAGKYLHRIRRLGKYLIWDFRSPSISDKIKPQHCVMVNHLGMSGSFSIQQQQYNFRKHDHVCWQFNNKLRLIYNDPRRFGFIKLFSDYHQASKALALGVEPFAASFTPEYLLTHAHTSKTSVKSLLLNQKVIAGIGNIYAAEILWHCDISPLAPAASIDHEMARRIVNSTRKTLRSAIAANGSTLKDHKTAVGISGSFQNNFVVYGKAQQPCTKSGCSGIIQRVRQQGRSSFYCPRHQAE